MGISINSANRIVDNRTSKQRRLVGIKNQSDIVYYIVDMLY